MSRRTGRLPAIGVSDAMSQLDGTWLVEPTTSLDELSAHFREHGHRGAVVVDSSGRLQGVVTMTDLERAAVDGNASTVAEILSRAPLTAFSDETLDEIVKHAGMLDVGYIPVVTRERPNEPIGLLQRSDIIRAYGSAISVRDRRRVSFERRRAQHLFGLQPIEIMLEEGDPGVGKTLREIHPPPETVIVAVNRGEVTMVPRGETLLKVGDRIAALALGDGGHILGRLLKGGNYR
jgi:predicted transcriptional regulator